MYWSKLKQKERRIYKKYSTIGGQANLHEADWPVFLMIFISLFFKFPEDTPQKQGSHGKMCIYVHVAGTTPECYSLFKESSF